MYTGSSLGVTMVTGHIHTHIHSVNAMQCALIVVRFCIPKFGKKIRHAGARSKMHTKIRSVCSEKAHFAENIFRMHFLVEER